MTFTWVERIPGLVPSQQEVAWPLSADRRLCRTADWTSGLRRASDGVAALSDVEIE